MHLCLANAAIPIVSLVYPRLFWVLPAVIGYETLVAVRTLGVTPKRTLLVLSFANVISALIGAALLLALCLTFLKTGNDDGLFQKFGFAFWMYPGRTDLRLTLGVMLGFFGVCYVVSVYVERWIVAKFYKAIPEPTLRRYSWRVHLPTYALIACLWTTQNLMWILGEQFGNGR